MGVHGLWEVLSDVAQERSLAEFVAYELVSWKRNGRDAAIIGVDASELMYAAQSSTHSARVRGASRASEGKNADLRLVFKQLIWLASTFYGQILVFVFDGPDRPQFKRGKRVGKCEHWMVEDFQRLIRALGLHVHQAPGEAEAELAYLNDGGLIDLVFTSDSDVFVFGATNVIRSSRNTSDHDTVKIYTHDKLQSEGFNRTALIFLAVMMGGDYDSKGLRGCGGTIASALCHSDLAHHLHAAITVSSRHSARQKLAVWRDKLRRELSSDPHGHLGRRHQAVAAAVTEAFPPLDTTTLYARPLTSGIDRSFRPDPSLWVHQTPDTPRLCSLVWELFNCRDPIKICRESVWVVQCVRQLAQIDSALSRPATEGFGKQALAHIKAVKRFSGPSPSAFPCYKARFDIGCSVLPSAIQTINGLSGAELPKEVWLRNALFDVWVPGPILEMLAPDKVARFHESTGIAPISVQPYNPVFPSLGSPPALSTPSLSDDSDLPTALEFIQSLAKVPNSRK